MMQVIAEHPIIFQGVIWGCSALETETVKMGNRYKILDRRNSIRGVNRVRFFYSGRGGNTRFSLDHVFI